jgi:hypothetical protein
MPNRVGPISFLHCEYTACHGPRLSDMMTSIRFIAMKGRKDVSLSVFVSSIARRASFFGQPMVMA